MADVEIKTSISVLDNVTRGATSGSGVCVRDGCTSVCVCTYVRVAFLRSDVRPEQGHSLSRLGWVHTLVHSLSAPRFILAVVLLYFGSQSCVEYYVVWYIVVFCAVAGRHSFPTLFFLLRTLYFGLVGQREGILFLCKLT